MTFTVFLMTWKCMDVKCDYVHSKGREQLATFETREEAAAFIEQKKPEYPERLIERDLISGHVEAYTQWLFIDSPLPPPEPKRKRKR